MQHWSFVLSSLHLGTPGPAATCPSPAGAESDPRTCAMAQRYFDTVLSTTGETGPHCDASDWGITLNHSGDLAWMDLTKCKLERVMLGLGEGTGKAPFVQPFQVW